MVVRSGFESELKLESPHRFLLKYVLGVGVLIIKSTQGSVQGINYEFIPAHTYGAERSELLMIIKRYVKERIYNNNYFDWSVK